MKVSDLLQEKAGLNTVGTWPPGFLSKVYKTFHIDAKTQPSVEDKKPTLEDLKKKIFLSKGANGSFAALGLRKSSGLMPTKSPLGILFKNGQVEMMSGSTLADHLKQIPKGQYFSLPYMDSSSYTTRSMRDTEMRWSDALAQSGEIMRYMNKIFLPALKVKAGEVIDRVYANLRKISNKKDSGLSFSKSDQENVLAAVAALEKMLSRGFTTDVMEEFLKRAGKISYGWGSMPTNYDQFVNIMKKPNARAKFARMIFDEIKKLDHQLNSYLEKNDSQDKVKDA